MQRRIAELRADAGVSREECEAVAIEFGMYSWHYRRAWEEVYARDGQVIATERLFDGMPESLGQRVRADADELGCGTIELMRMPVFETNYTPEDRLVMEEAFLRARQDAAAELATRLRDGKIPDYERIVLRWKMERLKIEEELLSLRDVARKKPQWAAEIAGAIHEYELGFTGAMGMEATVEEVRGKVEEYTTRE
ncbi:MAG: hypothetical protein ABIG71_01535 [Candidatus Uhrbacteria bacterium]